MPKTSDMTPAILANRTLRFVDCIKIELSAQTLLYTNYEADLQVLSIDGSTLDTYLTGQGFIGHSPITTTGQAQPEKVDISFDSTQLDSSANLLAPAFFNGDTTGAPVTITKVFVNSLGSVGFNYIAFKGIVDNFSAKVTDTSQTLTVFCGGQFSNFDKQTLYGFTNSKSQQIVYPNDTGFDFSANNSSNIRWEE